MTTLRCYLMFNLMLCLCNSMLNKCGCLKKAQKSSVAIIILNHIEELPNIKYLQLSYHWLLNKINSILESRLPEHLQYKFNHFKRTVKRILKLLMSKIDMWKCTWYFWEYVNVITWVRENCKAKIVRHLWIYWRNIINTCTIPLKVSTIIKWSFSN